MPPFPPFSATTQPPSGVSRSSSLTSPIMFPMARRELQCKIPTTLFPSNNLLDILATLRHAWGGFPGEDGSQGVKVKHMGMQRTKAIRSTRPPEKIKKKDKTFSAIRIWVVGNWELGGSLSSMSQFLISYCVFFIFLSLSWYKALGCRGFGWRYLFLAFSRL